MKNRIKRKQEMEKKTDIKNKEKSRDSKIQVEIQDRKIETYM